VVVRCPDRGRSAEGGAEEAIEVTANRRVLDLVVLEDADHE
jgi:hypothetical protein